MEINSKLIEFKNNVGDKIDSISSSTTTLESDLNSFNTITNSISSNISSAFKGNGANTTATEMEYIKQTTKKTIDSITSELMPAVEKCKDLNNKISELINEQNQINALQAELSTSQNNTNVQTDATIAANTEKSSQLNSKLSNFYTKEEQLLQSLEQIKNMDSSVSILKEFGNKVEIDSSLNLNYNGVEFSTVYYEKDGVIYQKVIPICKNGTVTLDEQYTIIYDENKLLSTDRELGQEVINFLRGKANGTIKDQWLWDFNSKKYNKDISARIANVMDCILESTYKANNAKTVSDYATVAAVVGTNSVMHFGYWSGNKTERTEGFSKVLANNGGDLDCIGFVTWCYYQGVAKTNSPDNISVKETMSPLNILLYYSDDLSKMSTQEKASIPVGSVLSRPVYDGGKITNWHVGMVIGHTTVDGEKAVVVAQSSNKTIGANIRYYKYSELGSGRNEWLGVSTPEDMTKRVTVGDTNRKERVNGYKYG